MALTLENEFVVEAPIETTWHMLLDLERVATCLPGASIEGAAPDGGLLGKMQVKLGPVTMDYSGTVRIEESDERARVTVMRVDAREIRGQGSASARIRNTLSGENGSTRVQVHTELNVTGRPAQFGRGIMQDVASRLLADFALRLSDRLSHGEAASERETAPTSSPSASALDLTPAVSGALGRRVLTVTGLAALARFVARLARRRAR